MDIVYHLQKELHNRAHASGGFGQNIGEDERPDATAWAVRALWLVESESELVAAGLNRLATQQKPDGRIALTEDTPNVYWPTPIGLLAWDQDNSFLTQRNLAVEFLLSHGSNINTKKPPFIEHNTSLQGWSWVANTYSWVEPTAMVLMALASQGYTDHPRYKEGITLLVDRMLPEGGWNYGNRKVFDSRLRPLPDYTGIALCALRKEIEKEAAERSLLYLEAVYPHLITPLSLSWVIRGLAGYGMKPANAADRIRKCLELQGRYGPFETSLVAQLTIALIGA